MNRSILIGVIFFALLSGGCKKTDNYALEPVSDYYPLTVGKYITYTLDSIVFTNFGTETDTFQYQIQYVVDAQVVDNLNRPAYRIVRYIRLDSTEEWVPDHTDLAVNTGHTLEFTEDNMKDIKLI